VRVENETGEQEPRWGLKMGKWVRKGVALDRWRGGLLNLVPAVASASKAPEEGEGGMGRREGRE
jgi:hypothetical protein